MYTICLMTAIGLIVGATVALCVKRNKTTYDRCFFTIACGIVGSVGGVLCAHFFLPQWIPDDTVDYGPLPLVAMQGSDGREIAFVLGSSTGAGTPMFFFVGRRNDGAEIPTSVPANQTVHIVEDPDLKNEGTMTFHRREKDPFSSLVPWCFDLEKLSSVIDLELRVPVGSVIRQPQDCICPANLATSQSLQPNGVSNEHNMAYIGTVCAHLSLLSLAQIQTATLESH